MAMFQTLVSLPTCDVSTEGTWKKEMWLSGSTVKIFFPILVRVNHHNLKSRLFSKEPTPPHTSDQEGTTAPSLTGLSTKEVATGAPSSHCLCRFSRQEGLPIPGDSFCRKEYLTLKRSVRNRLKGKLMMGCYKVKIRSSNTVQSVTVDRQVPDKLSARFWEAFVQAEKTGVKLPPDMLGIVDAKLE
jgi:hypothetical protein